MSERVWITKTGFRAMEWNGNIREYVDKPITNIFHEFRTACHIEDNVTLGDIIKIVGSNKKLSDFVGSYAWANVQAFYQEVSKEPVKKSNLKWIEISRSVEICSLFKGDQGNAGEIQDSISVSGRDDSETVWAIDLSPVNEISHCIVRINPEVKVYDSRKTVSEGYKEVATGHGCFTLQEVLTEIFFEISFLGSPSDRDEVAANLKQTIEDIESGKAKTVPFEFPDKETIQ